MYWMDDKSNEKHHKIFPNYEVTLYIKTKDYTEGEKLTLSFLNSKSRKFKGNKDKQTVSGTVGASGIVCVKNFKIEYEC